MTITSGVEELSAIVKAGRAREHYKANDVVTLDGVDYKIIGFDHDAPNSITLMRNELLPYRVMHTSTTAGGWKDTTLRKWLNDEYIKELSDKLISHIIPVQKVTHTYDGKKTETKDKIFICSESEMFGSAIYSYHEDGARYEAFATSELRALKDEDGDYDWYWTRSPSSSANFAIVSSYGNANHASATNSTVRVAPCFTIS